jgi:hypothetical protein
MHQSITPSFQYSNPSGSWSNAYATGIANQKRTSFAYLTRERKKIFTNSHSCDLVGYSIFLIAEFQACPRGRAKSRQTS